MKRQMKLLLLIILIIVAIERSTDTGKNATAVVDDNSHNATAANGGQYANKASS